MRLMLMAVVLMVGCQQPGVGQGEVIIGQNLYTAEHQEDVKAPAIESALADLDDAHFDEATKGSSVFVEFYARWCSSCRELAPSLDRLQKRHPSTKFYRVDVDANPISSDKEEVKMVPEMIIFKRGKRMGSLVGGYPDNVLDRFVDTTL
jgi:thioredoxin 1